MSSLTWCQLVEEFCRVHGLVYADVIETMRASGFYKTAQRKFYADGTTEEIARQLEYAARDVADGKAVE